MKLLILAVTFISTSAFAFQEGTFNCSVDAFTNSTIVVKSVALGKGIRVPYVDYSFYKEGVQHRMKGIAQTDLKTTERRDKVTGEPVISTEEVLFLNFSSGEIISFGPNGEVSADCTKAP